MKDLEIQFLKNLRSISNPTTDTIFRLISFLGEQYFLIIILLSIYYLFDKRIGQRIVYAMITTICLNNAIKGLIKYSRPFIYDTTLAPADNAINGATGYSFPSGHTQNATTAYSSIALSFKNKKITIITLTIIILIALSRLFLGVHYPKDVLFGFIFGIICTLFSFYVFKKNDNNPNKIHLLYLITLLIFLPFTFIFWSTDYDNLLLLRDFYISYSLSVGLILGMILENKYVNFEKSNLLKINILRLIGSLTSLLIVYLGFKLLFSLSIFPQEGDSYKILFDSLRYFFVGVTPLGIFPIIFKNKLFKKAA